MTLLVNGVDDCMIKLKVPGLKKTVPLKSILWIEGVGNYSKVHFTSGDMYLASVTLKGFEDQLSSFIRVHRGALVNQSYVARFEQQTFKNAQVILDDGRAFSIPRRRIETIKEKLIPHVVRNE